MSPAVAAEGPRQPEVERMLRVGALDTGPRQLAAIARHPRRACAVIENLGHYLGDEVSACMEKDPSADST